MTAETTQVKTPAPAPVVRGRVRPARILLHAFLIFTALSFLAPLFWTLYTSLRPYADTAERGYVSWPGTLNFDNYTNAWTQADLPQYYFNTLIITIPGVIITLLLASFVAFGVARFSWRGNIALLIVFTAGNLLPQQIILTPLYRLYLEMPLPWWMSE